ncbi:MAG: nucleotidyltransferase family protein [Lachnospiraceae bacterium]|nr:nucleotidyltransferase family protein [Lachnospiraceae bacterium]
MNRVLFEGRFLVSMISTMIQKDTLQVRYGRMDWERMFRIADYHRVANIIYLGLLGNGGRVPERWMNRFFERYQESLLGGENCEAGEREILTLLDMERIPCVVLSSSTTRGLYEIRETADMSPLRLYLSPDGYSLVKGFLIDLGYETIRNYPEFGERMYRISGLSVDIYHKLPFKTKFYEKGMRALSIRARIRRGGESVRILSAEDRLIFRLASVSYQYTVDELLIRDMLDLFLYHKAWRRQLNGVYVKKKLQDFRVDGLAEKLLRLAYMWFGAKEDKEYMQSSGQPEDLNSFDVLENRIFSRGEFGKESETDPQALALARMLMKEDEKEAKKVKKQEFKKKMTEKKESAGRHFHWIFPEYKYMSDLYPNLSKFPFLLPFYWVLRGIRMLIGMIKNGGQQS